MPPIRSSAWILLVSAAYFLSGLCALIYETVWIYKFSRIFGSTVFAMSFVVAAFFGGLALGSRIFGKASAKTSNPLRWYAILEFAIGVYALAFPWIIALTEQVYAGLYPSVAESFALMTVVRMALAFVVLLPPTMMMGGTLPLLVAQFADRLASIGNRTGLIYGLNALGAAAGSFLTGYALLKTLGVANTNALAGALNLAIGALAWALSWRVPLAAMLPPVRLHQGTLAATSLPVARRLAIASFAASGFVSMSYEVIWLRYLTFYFHDTIYLYTGIIAIFVLGIGAGSLLCARVVSNVKCPLAFFGLLEAGIGILTVLAIYLPIGFRQSIYEAGARSGGNVLLILLALLFTPALLMGATFPVVTKIIVADLRSAGGEVGRAYALNTLGCILGLLCSGFVLHNFLGIQGSLCLLFGLNMLLAALLLVADRKLARPYFGALPLLAAIALAILVERWPLQLPLAIIRTGLGTGEKVMEVREGLTGITWATQAGGQGEVHLWANGIQISRGGRSTVLAQGYIPMLLAPRIPRNVLGLAFGAGLSYRAARLFPEVRRLDFVDISRQNIEVALRNFPENAGLKDDPRARFIIDDAYSYLKYNETRYEMIQMEPTPPHFSYQTASLYTREFYTLARQRLADGGWCAQVLPLNDLSPEETAGVMRTFSEVFAHCLLWRNGWDCLMIGSGQEYHLDLQAISERLDRPEIQRTLRECSPVVEKFYILDNFLSGLLLADEDFRKVAEGGSIYTDDKSALKFTTGRDITVENIRNIHSHLSSWADIRKLFAPLPGFKAREPRLAVKREYFMVLLYQHYPSEFCRVFMRYATECSTTKVDDLKVLRSYLRNRGMNREAGEVQRKIEELEDLPLK